MDQLERRILRQEARSIGMCGECASALALPERSRCRKCMVRARVTYFRREGLRPGERRCGNGCGAIFEALGTGRKICPRCAFASRSSYVDPNPVDIDEYLQGSCIPVPIVADPREQVVELPALVGADRDREAKQYFERSLIELRENEVVERRRFAEDEEERRKDRAQRERREAVRRAQWEQDRAIQQTREAAQAAEVEERERLLEDRRSAQAQDRASFEAMFSEEFLIAERERGLVLDLCGPCRQPYWIPYASLVNWGLHWEGPPRCRTCYCPPLTARVRRENPAWTPLHVSHEVVMAIWGYGPYAQAVELRMMHDR
jgi:hypothetical protein